MTFAQTEFFLLKGGKKKTVVSPSTGTKLCQEVDFNVINASRRTQI